MTVSASGSANEAPEVPDNVGDWLRGVYRFATDRNDFRRSADQFSGTEEHSSMQKTHQFDLQTPTERKWDGEGN
ncbi:hypothetical protein STEG23_025483 [Scotinomys teguina]